MKITHKAEEDLIPHYEAHPVYYSFADQKQTMENVFKAMDEDITTKKTILDVGCGSGGLGKVFSQLGATYVGVDYSKIRINMAKISNIPNCTFHLNDVYVFLEEEIKAGNKYDTITIFEVLEHLVEPERIVEMSKKLLTDNGVIIASVPHNMPYVAHLQVYENEQAVKDRLNPDKVLLADGQHYFCKWKNETK